MKSKGILLTKVLALLAWHASVFAQSSAADSVGQNQDEQETALIIMKDYSQSTENLPPDTSQAFITQLIRLADLSQQPVKVAVILFGGQGVTVLGDESGMPTSAYESLHQSVMKSWPNPAGGTPLEEASEVCVQMVKGLPPNARTCVILFSDGRPESGVLQPDRYPEVRQAIDRTLTRLQTKYQANTPAFVQKILSDAERVMRIPGTDQWKELYAIQLKAEFEKTVKHGAALKEAGVRFLSVDYTSGIAELKQIHEAAGGKPDDYVHATPPSVIIPKLHSLGLTALPRVIVQHPKRVPADPDAFDAVWTLGLDAVGEAAVVTALFDPPVPDFEKNAALELILDGKTRKFSVDNNDSNLILSFDSAGNVVTATIALDRLPRDGQVSLHYTSPSATLHVPGCTFYTHLRMVSNLKADFRPVHLADDVRQPFRVSPNHPLKFVGLLRSESRPQPYPIASMEPVLRDRFTGREIRIAMNEDPQRADVFVSNESRLARGSFDLELNIVLPSGAQLVLKEANVLECQAQNEFISVEIPLPAGDQTEGTSVSRAHLAFPPVGDAVTKRAIPIVIRSMNIDFPITVTSGVIGLADEHGVSPREPWITFDQSEIYLEPGRAQRVLVTLRLPDNIEESISDGRFEGRLAFERLDLRQRMPLRRYGKIAGVADDEPVEPVTFTLARPWFEVSAPRGFRNMLESGPDKTRLLPIPVSVWQPFARRVVLEVNHTSVLSREITVFPQATFVDKQGRMIPSVRLVLAEDCEATEEVRPGETARWVLAFEVDDDNSVSKAFGSIVVSGPGITPVHIPVEVEVRQPLLGKRIKAACYLIASVLLLLALAAAVKFTKVRRLRTGRAFVRRSGQQLPELLEFSTNRGEPKLTVKKEAVVKYPPNKSVKLRPDRALPNDALAEISRDDPCVIQSDGREVQLTNLYSTGERYSVHGTYTNGGRFTKLNSKYFRSARNHARPRAV